MRLLALKAISAAGTAAVCAAAGALVLADPKPSAAPLKPATGQAGTPPLVTPTPTPTAPGSVIPVIPPACIPGRAPAPSARQALAQLRAATSAAARRAILAALPPDERLQVMAVVAARARCAVAAPSSEQISPSAVAGPEPGVAVTNTHLS